MNKLYIVIDYVRHTLLSLSLQDEDVNRFPILYYDSAFYKKFNVEDFIRSQHPGVEFIQKSYPEEK